MTNRSNIDLHDDEIGKTEAEARGGGTEPFRFPFAWSGLDPQDTTGKGERPEDHCGSGPIEGGKAGEGGSTWDFGEGPGEILPPQCRLGRGGGLSTIEGAGESEIRGKEPGDSP